MSEQMTEQARLRGDLHTLRELIGRPTSLSPWRFNIIAREAQRLGDQCWYYAGWYAAQPDKVSKGVGESTLAKLERVINILQPARKSRGRPRKTTVSFVDFLIGIKHSKDNPAGESLESYVKYAMQVGALKRTTEPGSHKRRIQRVMSDK
jgi:hypothetical protein